MSHQLVVPALGESVSEATVARWLKKVGDNVKMDDPLVELETDKVTLEVNAPHEGVLEQITAPQGTIVQVGQALGSIGQNQGQPSTQNQTQAQTLGQAQGQSSSQAPQQGQFPSQIQGGDKTQSPPQQPRSSMPPYDNSGPQSSDSQSYAQGNPSFGPSTPPTPSQMPNVNAPLYTPYTAYGPQQQNPAPANTYYPPSAPSQQPLSLRDAPSPVSYIASSQELAQDSGQPSHQKPPILSPAARKMAAENNIAPQDILATGRDGRITKEDVRQHQSSMTSGPVTPPSGAGFESQNQPQSQNYHQMQNQAQPSQNQPQSQLQPQPPVPTPSVPQGGGMPARQFQVTQVAHPEERVRMTRLRQRIAERLKEAQNTAAMLTTFNEIDMSHVMATRESYREKFEKRFGIKLGFMSFFVKAAVSALKEIPSVNAEIEGEYIVYKNHYDIGVAVSAPQGLVVPVVRDADYLNFAEIESNIGQLSEKARTGKLSMSDLSGGTFTITNGGVFGSLMSTPILNPPQSGILGMHKIQKRAVVIDDRVEIRPMMYVALTYDHRIIDGREAVTFLVRIKENIEDPQRILLGI